MTTIHIICLPHDKILYSSVTKTVAKSIYCSNNEVCSWKGKIHFGKKEKNAGYQLFFLFSKNVFKGPLPMGC